LARELAAMLQHLAPYPEIMVEPAGLALTTHLGLGAVGVCAVRAGTGPQRDVVQDGQGYHR
jgi:fatty acid-binding protein DegV